MTPVPERFSRLAPLQQAYLTLEHMQRRLDEAERVAHEPIAIVGLGCRFPGGDGPDEFWRMLRDGVDAIREAPPGRWDEDTIRRTLESLNPSMPAAIQAGFLDDIDGFDHDFFGISPREAVSIDPQQRLLLEVAWEALEDAGQTMESLSGSRTGVFVGIHSQSSDYFWMQAADGARVDPYTATGTAHSVIAGRLSYLLNLQGPSIALDTACSSSLAAVHLACQSLRLGESTLAIAGGVNLRLSPEFLYATSKMGTASSSGRCRAFDAAADGIVFGEGCGVVVLKRLSDAVAAGERVWAVVRGSAINQDGRSAGLTAPSVAAQQAVIRAALANARAAPEQIGYVEAHGTGTSLGDPIEIEALAETVGLPRSSGEVCAVGSVKSNIGHLEGAAGIAGMIKAVLALWHQTIPPSLHVRQLNPNIRLEGTSLRVASETRPWPAGSKRRFAGVSSFGWSGANAHVVIEEAGPAKGDAADGTEPLYVLPLSAHGPEELRRLAQSYAELLTVPSAPVLRDLCYTAAVRRTHHRRRLCVSGRSPEELAAQLREISVPLPRRKTVFVFSGQGSQWAGMGCDWMNREPVVRDALERCEAAMRPHVDWSLKDALRKLDRIDVIQPALFAMQVAIAAMWRSWGIEPDAVIGHSMGEVAAAHVAGALTLEDAARIICRRSRLLRRISGRGAMAMVNLPLEECEAELSRHTDRLSPAVSNGPNATVISGDAEALTEVVATLERRGVFCRWVKIDVAAHSPQVDSLRDELLETLDGIRPQPANVPFYSTVTGEALDTTDLDRTYWVRNLRSPVLFWQGIRHLAGSGHDVFVEISPHPILLPAIPGNAALVPSLRRDQDERSSMLTSLGALYETGHAVQWRNVYPSGNCVRLPRYPWQHRRFWLDAPAARRTITLGNPLLGRRIEASTQPGTFFWETDLSLTSLPWLADHLVQGQVVLPATAYLDMALSGASEIFGESACVLERVTFTQMLIVPREEGVTVQLAITQEKPGVASFRISSRHSSWVLHASGDIRQTRTEGLTAPPDSPETIEARCRTMMPATDLWQLMAEHGVEYGASFRSLEHIWSRDGEAIGRLRPAESGTPAPAFLDACLQVVAAAFGPAGGTWLPAGIDSVRWPHPGRLVVWSHARVNRVRADLSFLDAEGQLVGGIDGLRLQRLDSPQRIDTRGWLHELRWVAQPLATTEPQQSRSWIIASSVGTAIAEGLRARGDRVTQIAPEALDTVEPLQEIVLLLEHERSCDRVLRLLQILGRTAWRQAPRVWLVTRGAQPIDGRIFEEGMWQAPFWGLGRTVHYEHPELNCTLVDLDPTGGEDELIHELLGNNGENQVAFRGGARFAARVALHEPDLRPATFKAGDRPFRLEIEPPGVLDRLRLHATSRRRPQAGEVEIEVRAAGLNFLDVLLALGVLPDDAPGAIPGSPRLGGECSGRIVAVGNGVTDFRIGDDVVAFAPWSFGRFVTTPAIRTALKPANIPAEQAAALPIAFLTADYALNRAARVAPGERVLIHAATGGVGLAAIQIAQSAGAEIFATAGSPEKRAYLHALGVSHASDSRSTAFVEDVRNWTNGEGVDVVLNSLSGDLMEASFDLLRDHGRFIEIGKRDYYAGRKLGLRPFLKNLSFTLVDLLGMSLKRPLLIRDLLREMVAKFESGALRPVETRVTPVTESAEAFHTMAQARHIGKIVIAMRDSENAPIAPMRSAFDPDGTYLITGGLGGLGLTVARWMIGRGARRLVLMGRRSPSPEVQEAIDAVGADVRTIQADVSQRDDVARVLSSIEQLRGVVHAAGVLDDAMLMQQTPAHFRRVMASKIDGAWNLHLLTRGCSLDHFVLFSSAAGLLGAPAQANYAAANAFLDALASYRRTQGLPALSIGWGAWSEVGLAAAQSNRGGRLALRGMENLTPERGLVILEQLLNSSASHVAAMPIDVRQWRQFYPKAAQSSLFELLRQEAPKEGDAPNALRARLLSADAHDRRALLEAHLQQQLARVLHIDWQAIDPMRPLKELGFDSLMALEFRNRLEVSLGLTLPATLIWGHPTLAVLTPHLASQMGLPVVAAQRAASAPEGDSRVLNTALTGLDDMSEDAAVAALRARS